MWIFCLARKLIDLLLKKGTDVYLVSGGLRRVIQPVMDYLNIPRDNLYANRIIFDSKGERCACVCVRTRVYVSECVSTCVWLGHWPDNQKVSGLIPFGCYLEQETSLTLLQSTQLLK